MSIAGVPVTVNANGIAGRRRRRTPVAAHLGDQHTAQRARYLRVGQQRHRHQQRPFGQPLAPGPHLYHRPQDPRQRGLRVRLAVPLVLHLAAPGGPAGRPAAHPRAGRPPGELHRLAAVHRGHGQHRVELVGGIDVPRQRARVGPARPSPGTPGPQEPQEPPGVSPATRVVPARSNRPVRRGRPRRRAWVARARRCSRPSRPRPSRRPSRASGPLSRALLGVLAAAALAFAYRRVDDAARLLGSSSCAEGGSPPRTVFAANGDELSDFGGPP